MNERARVAAVGVLRSIGTSRGVLLTRSDCAITSGHVTSDVLLRGRLLDELTRRQLPSGGWATSTTSRQAALEPSCLAALALALRSDSAHGVQDFLLRVQNPNGSWPAFEGDDPDGSWVTSLAMIALCDQLEKPALIWSFASLDSEAITILFADDGRQTNCNRCKKRSRRFSHQTCPVKSALVGIG